MHDEGEIIFRSATPNDAGAIARVHVAAWQHSYRSIIDESFLAALDPADNKMTWVDQLTRAGSDSSIVLVAEAQSDGICGFASGGAARRDWGADAELYAIYLMPDRQRRGVGRLLCRELGTQLFADGFESLVVWVLAANPARGFYEALGGEVIRERDVEIGAQRLREVAYAWPKLTDFVNRTYRGANDEAPIEIVTYDPAWPALFEAERELLAVTLRRWLVGPIEQVGSTAVPGLAAKPVIDIMAAVESLDASRGALGVLRDAGYHYAPYRADLMHWFCKASPSFRTHHLHLVPYRSGLWSERIAFRDCLRSDPAIAREYADLKYRLAVAHRFDREAYADGKGPFVTGVVRKFLAGEA